MPRTPNRLYFARRAEQSAVAVAEATDPGARLAHTQLRAAYTLLATPPEGGARFARAEPAATDANPATLPDALANWANEGGAPE